MNQTQNRLPILLVGSLFFIFLCCITIVGVAVIAQTFFFAPNRVSSILETPSPRVIIPTVAPAPTPAPAPTVPPVAIEGDIETQIYSNVYQRVNPSVVAIRILDESLLEEQDSQLRPFFFNTGEGSGFVLDTEGNIATNRHVIRDASSIVVRFYDGILAPAEVVGEDPDTDLAVIKVDPSGLDLRPVTFGSIDELHVGDRIMVIGNPFGNTNSLTTGIVSALGRDVALPDTQFRLPEVIQTDAAINPGNSGGPMLNAKGEVVGVAFMLQSETRANSGIGFGIPVYFVEKVTRAIIEKGEYRHSYLGIRGNGLSPFEIQTLGLNVDYGVLIAEVLPGTPAEKAGLRGGEESVLVEGAPFVIGGDIIIAINGQPIKTFDDLLAFLGRYTEPGDVITLTIVRDDQQLDVDITLGPRPRF